MKIHSCSAGNASGPKPIRQSQGWQVRVNQEAP